MSKRAIIVLVIFSVIVVAMILFNMYLRSKLPQYSWVESYSYKSNQPYGAKVLYDILNTKKDERKLITLDKNRISQIDTSIRNTNYIFIGNCLLMDSDEFDYLLDYADRGNNAFIATNSLPDDLMDEYELEYEIYNKKSITTSFLNNKKEFQFHFQFLKDTVVYQWRYLNKSDVIDNIDPDDEVSLLSEIDRDKINYFKVKYGSGNIYIHTNPILFTNYYLINKNGFDYANQVFSEMKEGDIYWDEINKSYSAYNSEMHQGKPLRYILSQRSLRWAWYLGIITIILFVIFRAKREQKIIPIIDKNKNTSLEFINNIGALYYQAKDHRIIANEIMLLFYSFIRNRYGIQVNIKNKPEMIKEISQKSEIDEEKIKELFDLNLMAQFHEGVDNKIIVKFYESVENFYKNCR
ncbi:MAG: hypothetical protein K9J13_01550 [Saprospiraceae bacterium]|nr:hypothetical protein [Saprospiraceae bacterium]